MFRFRPSTSTLALSATLLAVLWLGSAPLAADWLVTEKGELIETLGPWTIDGESLTYQDPEGRSHTVELRAIDLEGSEETTAMKAGRPYVPKPRMVKAEDQAAEAEAEQEPIVLYMTSWCGYCRKARKLLDDLDANFVEKNIEKDREAALEFRKKAGRGSGIPVIDFDGTIVRGYNAKLIKELAEKHKAAAPSES